MLSILGGSGSDSDSCIHIPALWDWFSFLLSMLDVCLGEGTTGPHTHTHTRTLSYLLGVLLVQIHPFGSMDG